MQYEDFQPERLYGAIQSKDVKAIRSIFEEFNLIDIADALNQYEPVSDLILVFKTVPPTFTAEVFSYLDPDIKERLIHLLSSEQIGGILENLYTDDIVDFIEEMPSNLMIKILQSATKETRSEVNHLLDYPDNSAGSIMTTEFVELKASDTIPRAMEKIRKYGKEAETISYLFVVDAKRILVGTLKLKDLIFATDEAIIEDIMETDIVSVFTHNDQEEVAQIFKHYDLNAIPVTTFDNRLVGIVTADDIIDVIDDEASEDIQLMAAVSPLQEEYMKTPVILLARKRLIWLFILMISATLTGMIINGYEEMLQHIPALSMFIPMLMDTGGNAGGQASTLMIRGIALGEITTKDYTKVLRKEFSVSLIAGTFLGVFDFFWIVAQNSIGIVNIQTEGFTVYHVAGLVALTLFFTVILAKTLGASLPLLAKKLKLDPALMAGPLLTTIVDALSLILYFTIATRLLHLV